MTVTEKLFLIILCRELGEGATGLRPPARPICYDTAVTIRCIWQRIGLIGLITSTWSRFKAIGLGSVNYTSVSRCGYIATPVMFFVTSWQISSFHTRRRYLAPDSGYIYLLTNATGCVLSPLLFNIFLEIVIAIALHGTKSGAVISGVLLSDLSFADDIALLAEKETGLQELVTINQSINQSIHL